ncbi:NodT family efflux transporter outer membrane factor (OMF) lipoprotein [Pseudoduganella lurida]|uniref:NodT family efflux transporter outer membrane factor (OMF) lipoprotein n=1 Tax=Pseudoduganella lurida TaxID=1036180 RepID=A0A562R772_9BURK|nr:efflux transporter outer membrane subunit [Pseudoduganella lurida]TWI64404.1 NodT family efflux transporter outer membrane factor (OMF) lipoprotein [Pseudoduganella lurida]
MRYLPRAAATALAVAMALSACAVSGPAPQVDAQQPPQWQAPLPHQGSINQLSGWWRSQGDPLLARLVDAAQAVSPTIASARTRIASAREQRVAAGAALAPSLDAIVTSSRTSQQSTSLPVNTTSQALLQASWEIDVFGANRAVRDAAQARLEGAQAGWHDARVSVAAETANTYYDLRACERLLDVARQDAASRADTARLTELTAKAGFQAPADAALSRASAADAANRELAQRAQCDVDVKALVALTAIAEPELRSSLAAAASDLTPAQGIAIDSLPAQTLAQRPDVFTAEREVAASSFEVGGARAQRYPRLSIAGSIGRGQIRAGGESVTANTWNIGPVQVSLPLFDAGRRRASVEAAQERYEAAVTTYRGSVRQAVREVEEALVNLQSTDLRTVQAQTALEGYRAAFTAVDDRYRNGMATLFELEDARRTRLAAENAMVAVQRERSAAWIALYRAAGGGWNRNDLTATASTSASN